MKPDPAVEVVDLDLRDQIFRSRSAEHKKLGVLADESQFMYPPEEWMDRIEKVLGDANARVSVTGNVGVSDYGNKASASVSVTLTCDQKEESLVEAHAVAKEMMRHFLAEDQHEMEQMLAQAQDGGTAPPKAASPPKASKPAVRATGGRPSFKRS